MDRATKKRAARCCSLEKQRLVEEIKKCDFCSESYTDLHHCYRSAAQASGERARSCVTG